MEVLTVILIFLIMAIIGLALLYWYMSYKDKKKIEEEEKITSGTSTKVAVQYTKKSIFKFMQFDKIEDNMIVQDNRQRYLMVIECEGVNYDLMSQVEKTAVESGFVEFLNTLRFPIQLYTQTRTVNIGESIQNYKNKLDITKKELDIKQQEYARFLKSDNYNEKQAELMRKEVLRMKNLYEYGRDVIEDIQKTSQNRNVLRKHYYIVVPYYSAEIGTDLLNEEEKKAMIFSELYTRAQSLIRALFSCEMKCKILDSNELVELLYIAYNRDESEIYSVEKAIQAGYNELYSTAPDVLDKRMKAINQKIEEDATKKANDLIYEAMQESEKERQVRQREEEMDDLINQMAEIIINENQELVGAEVAKKAKEKITKKKETTKKGATRKTKEKEGKDEKK